MILKSDGGTQATQVQITDSKRRFKPCVTGTVLSADIQAA